jgi:hypothetical protein
MFLFQFRNRCLRNKRPPGKPMSQINPHPSPPSPPSSKLTSRGGRGFRPAKKTPTLRTVQYGPLGPTLNLGGGGVGVGGLGDLRLHFRMGVYFADTGITFFRFHIYIYIYIYIYTAHTLAHIRNRKLQVLHIVFPRQLVTQTVSVWADGSRRHEGYRINEGGGTSSDDCKANFISARNYQANELSGQIAHV